VVRGVVIALLVVLIVGITTATLMPVIYNKPWFQEKYVNPPKPTPPAQPQ
jgi:hypothetical protein